MSSADLMEAEHYTTQEQDRLLLSLQLLWRRRGLLLRGAAYGLLAFVVIAFLLPKRYESTTRLMPPENQSTSGLAMLTALTSGSTGGTGMGASIGADLLGLKSSGALFVGILRSRTVADRLITHFDLRRHYGVIWAVRREEARRILAGRTDISEDRKSGIISVTVSDTDPQLSAEIARAYVEELDRLAAELTTSSAHRERVFLEERLKTVKQELDSAQRDLSEFSSKNTMLDLKDQGKAMVEAAATLQGQLIAAQSELQGVRQVYTNSNVRVRSVEARIDELQRQLDKLGGTGEPASGAKPVANSLYPSIRQLPLLGVTFVDLYRRTKVQEVVFETLTKQYELAKVQEAKEIPSVRVLDPALVPERRSFPPRIAVIASGTLLSVLIVIAWILLFNLWEQLEPGDSRRIFVHSVARDLRIHTSDASETGTRWRGRARRLFARSHHDDAEPGADSTNSSGL